jgi:hypothetical protein
MPRITFNGQSLAIDNRRIWIVGASVPYARSAPEQWAARIRDARQAGFNTIETACPWLLHEPRKGRFDFSDACDVQRFVEICHEHGMWVILRPGPYIGSGYDGGGIPAWLGEEPGVRLREASAPAMERIEQYLRKLLTMLVDLQITKNGPILAVQCEHGWRCSNERESARYLREITRIMQETGVNVPILNTNDLWQDVDGTINTWSGSSDLLVHLRQLRTVQEDAPRLVSSFDPARLECWQHKVDRAASPQELMGRLAEVLAAGGQAIVRPFYAGTNFGFLAGRLPGGPDRYLATNMSGDAPLAEGGLRGARYTTMKRLASFASNFGHVYADLDPTYQPVTMDLHALSDATDGRKSGSRKGASAACRSFAIVPLRGRAGRIVFVFGGEAGERQTTLVLDDGLRLPVDLGDQQVGWYVLDIDLHGAGRLDYCNLCPYAVVDRRIVVLQGPADTDAYLSVDGSPMHSTVPSGKEPLVFEHQGLTFVVCSQTQIDVTYCNERAVYVGIDGFDEVGEPIATKGYRKATVIHSSGEVEEQTMSGASKSSRSAATIELADWQMATTEEYQAGQSMRFASLDGPQSMSACGTPTGYGWYRCSFSTTAAKKRTALLPLAGDRIHLFLDGTPVVLAGLGDGATDDPFEISIGKGKHELVALVDNLGRFADGNDLDDPKGIRSELYEVKKFAMGRMKTVTADPVDPFSLRQYITGKALGMMSDERQAAWSFTYSRKAPLLLDIRERNASGTIVLNDQPIVYYAGASGACRMRLLLDPSEDHGLKRGKNELRFAPDPDQDDALEKLSGDVNMYECVSVITRPDAWSFARWEQPQAGAFNTATKAALKAQGDTPVWLMAAFDLPDAEQPMWLDTLGLNKGQAYLNGHNLGRYFNGPGSGRASAKATRLYMPQPWLHVDAPNHVLIFDEHGSDPSNVTVTAAH